MAFTFALTVPVFASFLTSALNQNFRNELIFLKWYLVGSNKFNSGYRLVFISILYFTSIVKSTTCTIPQIYFILDLHSIHVSDGLSVHHQKSKTVHTASGICHTGFVVAC